MNTVGSRIKNQRKKIGLTADEVAEKLNKNRATIYRYESDEIENLPITILEPLAEILKTTPAYLMGWNEDPVWGGSRSISEEDFKPFTIAAHADGELTDEEQEKVIEYIKFLKSQRGDSN